MAKKLGFLPIFLGLFLHGAVTGSAQQYFINLNAVYRTTNSAGVLVTARMTVPSLMNEIVGEGPVARTMALVFDVETGEVLVVQKSTGVVLGAWYQFDLDTTVNAADGVKAECYWDVSCPADDGYRGTAVGTVQTVRGTENELIKFKMNGRFTLRYQGEGGATRVYSGVFATGARYIAPATASR
jgi:hypothetical protein